MASNGFPSNSADSREPINVAEFRPRTPESHYTLETASGVLQLANVTRRQRSPKCEHGDVFYPAWFRQPSRSSWSGSRMRCGACTRQRRRAGQTRGRWRVSWPLSDHGSRESYTATTFAAQGRARRADVRPRHAASLVRPVAAGPGARSVACNALRRTQRNPERPSRSPTDRTPAPRPSPPPRASPRPRRTPRRFPPRSVPGPLGRSRSA